MICSRALLFNPPSGSYIRDDRCQVPTKGASSELRAPIDLAYMAATLEEAGVECKIKDYPAEEEKWDDLERDLLSFAPDLLIISTTTPTLFDDLLSFKMAKRLNKKILTVAKGAHFLSNDQEALTHCPELDITIRGEYEIAVTEIARGDDFQNILGISFRNNGKIQRTPPRPPLTNLDLLPLPARHLLNNKLYVRPDTGEMQTTIQSNRGCPARCVFCLVRPVSGPKVHSRSPDRIAREMEICVENFGIRNFYFRADTFTINKEWVIRLCDEIISRGLNVNWVCNSRVDTLCEERLAVMKKAGCWMIGFGVESGNQEILNKMKKGTTLEDAERAIYLCREYGIKTYLFWVLGLPWETRETALDTIRFAKRLDGDFAEFHIAYPFPGTEFHKIAIENHLYDETDLIGQDVKRNTTRSFNLSHQELEELKKRAVREFYLRPKLILRTLTGISSPKVFWNYLRKGVHVLRNP